MFGRNDEQIFFRPQLLSLCELNGEIPLNKTSFRVLQSTADERHTTNSRNNMCQKCEGDCGLWVLIEIIQKKCPENMKKIVGALWELPAK